MKKYKSLLFLFFICFSILASGMESKYELKLTVSKEANNVSYVEIAIKAQSSEKEFYLGNQNFRFTFDLNSVRTLDGQPQISVYQELEISGTSSTGAYGKHHLNGTKGNMISYNVELLGGQGKFIPADKWTSIGILAVIMENSDDHLNIKWNEMNDFPGTILTENISGNQQVINGTYLENFVSENQIETIREFKVYPNLIKDNQQLTVSYPSIDEETEVQILIIGLQGKILLNKLENLPQGSTNLSLTPPKLPSGEYFIQIIKSKQTLMIQPIIKA